MPVLTAEVSQPTAAVPLARARATQPGIAQGRLLVAPIEPADEAAWNAYIAARCARRVNPQPSDDSHVEATLFHTLAWRNAVCAAFPHQPLYLVARHCSAVKQPSRRAIRGVLPLFLVKSVLGGRMLVSVPYGVGGGVIADDDEARGALLNAATELAAQCRCRSLELRSEVAAAPDAPILDGYVGFQRDLPPSVDDLANWLPRKARAAARNARDRFGLTVDFQPRHLRTVWLLYAANMRRLGSISYPYRFFQALLDSCDRDDRLKSADAPAVWVSLVRQGDEPVAGLFSFVFGDRIMPYFYGASPASQRCSAANFAYFTLAQRAVEHGLRVFDFGRTRKDNRGSFDFKRFHGFQPRPLSYQRLTFGNGVRELSPRNPAFTLARRAWRHLPLWSTKLAGAWLSRHIPG